MNDVGQDATIVAIVGMMTQLLKPLLPNKFLPLITWLMGGTVGGIISHFRSGNVFEGVMRGLLAGAASNGVYSQVKRTVKKQETP